ncbi:adenylate/guanylate cyclase domain-containing protein [Segetibacter sp.]|jgi:adenylate cyclase|uniref:adenylate/guanylate cyclase domain-containing protein n=1 Tax=Segetibacter sp. TaxID=2231182 RepID=UPI002603E482|nr:adenylate/guanylate cyclase domain-containing protein [Segetibacter sp.]MCW3082455.1 guanylate cyclase [Segetibacter sp.]
MAKILVADDEVDLEMLIKQKFRRQIRESKYEFIFALNGNEALSKMQQHGDVEVVLTDINMPEMDGLTLLAKINEVSPLVKTVMVSAYGDMENIRTAMNRGAFDFVCKPVNFQDLELTIEKTMLHVAQVRQTLNAIKENNILRMYVDENVLKFMSGTEYEKSLLQNETVEATVAFLDICSFTSMTEKEPPNEVVTLLNNYFDVMVKEIIGQKGYIDKFIGDAIMAVFRGDYHLDRAIEACLAVRKQIENIRPQPGKTYTPKVSIGVNSGEVISGNIGSADLRRLDYTVIGDVVNTAQRLQSIAQAGQIVINHKSYEKIKESFNCEKLGEVSLKNKAKQEVVYQVLN